MCRPSAGRLNSRCSMMPSWTCRKSRRNESRNSRVCRFILVEGGTMPIRGLLDVEGAAFDPEDIRALIAAHEIALNRLQIADRKSATAFLVARTLIQIAKDGKRDPGTSNAQPVVRGAPVRRG